MAPPTVAAAPAAAPIRAAENAVGFWSRRSRRGGRRATKEAPSGFFSALATAVRQAADAITDFFTRAVEGTVTSTVVMIDDMNKRADERRWRQKTKRGDTPAPAPLVHEPVKVYCRLRPAAEAVAAAEQRVTHDGGAVSIAPEMGGMAPMNWFDGVVDASAPQEACHRGRRERRARRRSSTIVAIGALRSGKTHTLYGPAEQLCNPSDASWKAWGVLPRAAHHLFSLASAAGGLQGLLGRGASLRCSFVEVRGDEINDLLGHGRHLRVRESYLRGAHVPDAAERVIEWEEDIMRALVIGLQNRDAPLAMRSSTAAGAAVAAGAGGDGGGAARSSRSAAHRRRQGEARRGAGRSRISSSSGAAGRRAPARRAARCRATSVAVLSRCFDAAAANGGRSSRR